MPRMTIATLEEAIEGYRLALQQAVSEKDDALNRLAEEQNQRAEQARHVFLSYTPSGDTELDALQVAGRAIESLQDPEARQRCAAYLSARFSGSEPGVGS